jgi:hypothetical protein
MKKIIMIAFGLAALTGCRTMNSNETTRTPNGVRTVIDNNGPYSTDRTVVVDSTKAFGDCLSNVASTMGSAQADMYCRGQTASGPSGALGSAGFGPGMMAPMYAGAYAGMPGGMPIMITPSAAIALERYPGSAVPVSMPGASASVGDADSALITKELSSQDKRLCAIEKAQGKPCK